MKTPAIVVCVLGCFLAVGCRTNPKIHMLEQECRMHEDRIYALQDQLQMMESSLRDARRQNAFLGEPGCEGSEHVPHQKASASKSSSRSKSGDAHADVPLNVDVHLPGTGAKEISPDAFENMGVPSPGSRPDANKPKPRVSNPDALPSLETPDVPSLKQDWSPPTDEGGSRFNKSQTQLKDGKVLYRPEGPRLRGDSREVKKITISKMMTGGVNADGQKGDEGVFVVVEPRDADGKLVPAVGAVSIVAVDPALPEEKARVARWNFSADEVANQFRRSGSAEGFHLEVRWPDVPPRHEQLQLFVRYLTADLRKLYAEAPIQIALAPKSTTLVARPAPRRLDKEAHEGWASKPKATVSTEVSAPSRVPARSPSTDASPRVAWGPSKQVRQSIPPAAKKPASTKRPVARPRPVWSPER